MTIGKLAAAIGITAALSAGFNLVKDSVQKAFGRIDTMEQFERVMTVMLGSTEDANAALDKTNDIVTGTGYGLDVAAKSVQDFVTRGVEIDKATKYIEAWGDAVAFYGDGSNEQFANVTNALQNMLTKGTVGMDQLNRLFEAGIPAVDIFAQATGKLPEEVSEALSKGEISAEEFVNTVTNAMLEGTNGVQNISGAAKEAGNSWGGTFDNMGAAVARGVTSIIESIDNLLQTNGLPDMREMVSNFGSAFEDVLNGIAERIPVIISTIQDWRSSLEPLQPIIMGLPRPLLY